MNYTPQQASYVIGEINRVLNLNEPEELKVRRVWHSMAYLRASMLASMIHNTIGNRVFSGPFKGMQLTPATLSGAFAPALLGIYEHELHPVIERIIATPYKHILNIGCAYGYYSVGLALRMPQVKVHSFDIVEECRQKCRDMATLNNVQDRVTIGGEFRGEDFAAYADEKTLVIMDIEGAETTLLDPAQYPALQKMDVLVELHDLFDPAISGTVMNRFKATHETSVVQNRPLLFDFESMLGKSFYIDPFDNLIAAWESRAGPTPWGVMWEKN